MEKVIKYLIKNNITPNGLLALYTYYKKVGYSNYINVIVELKRLEQYGYLIKNNDNYEITDKGIKLLQGVEKVMASSNKSITNKEWDDNIQKYNEMFPKGRMGNSTVYYRANPKELRESFIWFFDKYPEYSWSDVLRITKKYIASFNDNYTYLRNSKYFIKKTAGSVTSSTLADILYNEDSIDNQENGFQYYGTE